MIRLNVGDRLRKLVARARADSYPVARRADEDAEDPADAVGDPRRWEVHGHWQLGYARWLGLQPHHRLLDVGCGSLRFGLRVIPFLDQANYVGFDTSEAAIETAMELVREADLTGQRPTLFCTERYQVYGHGGFDVVWAQSVLNQVPPDDVEAFFAMVENNLAPDGWVMVTCRTAETIAESRAGTGYRYPIDWLEARLPARLTIQAVDDQAGHPQGQDVLILATDETAQEPSEGAAGSSASASW